MANLCEYYPCHDNPCKNFSCEFCYCPLYMEDCEKYGGNPKFIKNKLNERLKDCTDCILPHSIEFLDNKEIKKLVIKILSSK